MWYRPAAVSAAKNLGCTNAKSVSPDAVRISMHLQAGTHTHHAMQNSCKAVVTFLACMAFETQML